MIAEIPTDTNEPSAPGVSPVLLQSLRLQNLLSFGPDTPALELGPLNILIGPNGSGKSNFISAICLLRSAPVSIENFLRANGGIRDWVWKGREMKTIKVNSLVTPYSFLYGYDKLVHNLELSSFFQNEFFISDEKISVVDEYHNEKPRYSSNGMNHVVFGADNNPKPLSAELINRHSSILQQLKDPIEYQAIYILLLRYSQIAVYREWSISNNSALRYPQRTDSRNDRLEEDFSNLGMFLNRYDRYPKAKRDLVGHLKEIYEGVDDFTTIVQGGTIQLFFNEGDYLIPATRLSDGTLRYLCLLAILCDPNPPPLICIEEPELGLHPDILPKIADLLVEASTRTQLIVTTHSDILIDAMTERPECVVVCEKHDGQTTMKRLERDELAVWLEKYRLGELWLRGEIGGTRW